ncbi:unnamed protein product [Rhizoctonia solani]|uniref:Uncharacterized protein n=1 Tax=Rhizoctonia solani TaxID=456999 RepID=A0A8H3AD64_9AGAM|nr:unnamed protein product [Rhizoctonia solani]
MGVKQLWTLLSPVGRPVPLETLEGKVLAIDSSIWLYQFQATMRDKEGRALVNAHILGFLRRISKLLFYGIKPVFVFDGGAPVLKRNTIIERKKRKSGAAASHAKVAEKLLAAQLRREALRHAEEKGREGTSNLPSTSVNRRSVVDDDANYLEDLSGPSLVLPGKHNVPPPKPASKSFSPSKPKSSSKPAEKTFREHDPYRLPELDTSIDARTLPNDPRLATDEELRAYISHLRPDDPEFHELPADAQYEILGELRLKSRTTSHRRLQKMLRQSKTAMDFSMAQIKNLGQRNRLTQEVLSTLNIVGTGAGGVVVPVKIAGEKNREYVLVRNEGGDRGFTLGIRQEGNTAEKPIVVEEDDEEGDDSFDSKLGDVWEDVVVPGRSQIGVAPDQDWRDFKRQNALDGLDKRDTRKHLAPLTTRPKSAAAPHLDKGKGKAVDLLPESADSHSSEEEDMDLQLAVQASLAGDQVRDDEEDEEDDLNRALALSLGEHNKSFSGTGSTSANPESASMRRASSQGLGIAPDSELFGAPNGLLGGDTLATSSPQAVDHESDFEDDDMDMEEVVIPAPAEDEQRLADSMWEGVVDVDRVASDLPGPEPTPTQSPTKELPLDDPTNNGAESLQLEPTSRRTSSTRRELAQALASSGDEDDYDEAPLSSRLMTILAPYQTPSGSGAIGSPTKKSESTTKHDAQAKSSNIGTESPTKKPSVVEPAHAKRVTWDNSSKFEVRSDLKPNPPQRPVHDSREPTDARGETTTVPEPPEEDIVAPHGTIEKLQDIPSPPQTRDETTTKAPSMPSWFNSAPTVGVSGPSKQEVVAEISQDTNLTGSSSEKASEGNLGDQSWESIPVQLSDDEEEIVPWSRSPTPTGARSPVAVPVYTEPDYDSARSRTSRLQDENEEHVSFMSQIQGKSYTTMRESLDAEIAALRKERAAALRDAEDVTAQMSAQIQVLLRLFGVPFVNAPMEAEAQCAFLAQHGLVEGVITDDSDVFLFGAGRVFRNMFNQSKTVECFLAVDLERELGLDRETLIALAYLLGSDYTEGLSGVGPVVAMEILKEFPGETGLVEFRTWWRKVQVGKDEEADLGTAFRKRFKKKFTSLHLTEEWPNPKVREAYLEPTVDSSEEKFEWGLPDLDGLRRFLADELSWSTEKVDDAILPIIRRMTQRSSSSGANRQGTLTSFLDGPAFTSSKDITRAPRKSQAYASKRLQQVVAAYRARKSGEDGADEDDQAEVNSENEQNKTKDKGSTKPRASNRRKVTQQAAKQDPEISTAAPKVAKRKRTASKADSARGSKRGRGTGARGRGRGRGKGGRSTASNRDEEEELVSDAGSESSKAGEEPEAPTPKKPRLRPRMKKPSPAPQPATHSESESGSSDEYIES